MNRLLKALTLLLGTVFALNMAMASSPDSTQVCQRLNTLQRQIPLPYHPSLVACIKDCLARPLPAEFTDYDSLFTAELVKYRLPAELKYLPLALSRMNTNHSRGDRAGVWDLPVVPALRYGLTVDEHHDERYAVEASTQAALQYLSDLHKTTGDWWETLLAYVNSPASLNRVKARHPGQALQPWEFADQHWMPDTDLLGDFIAAYYVYSSDDKTIAHSDEVIVTCDFDEPLSVAELCDRTGLSKKVLHLLNPLYRSDPFLPLEGYGLRLPQSVQARFETDREQIYEATAQQREKKAEEQAQLAEKQEKAKEIAQVQAQKERKSITYVVKSGDTLNKIAKKYHVKVSDLKKWNKLKGDMIREKQKLKIYQ